MSSLSFFCLTIAFSFRLPHKHTADAYARAELRFKNRPRPVPRRTVLSLTGPEPNPDHESRGPGASPMVLAAVRDELAYARSFNVQCKEIIEGLRPGESPFDRPDIIRRVYQLKRKELQRGVANGSVPGECGGILQAVEFQKRGRPHIHMLTPAKGFLRNYERIPAKGFLRNDECPAKRIKKL